MCQLCKAVERGDLRKYSCFYFIHKCNTCGTPMLILDQHEPSLDEQQQDQLKEVMKTFFPRYKLRGIGMRSIKSHWHEHLIK